MATRIVSAKVEKGKIYCTTDNDKVIVVDLNEGAIYGVSGKKLKTCPMFRHFMNDWQTDEIRKQIPMFNALGSHYYTGDRAIDTAYGIKRLKWADRLVNMGIAPFMARSIINHYAGSYGMSGELDDNATYKIIAKVLKAYPNENNYNDALTAYETALLVAKYKASFEGLTERQAECVRSIVRNIGDKYIPEVASWVRFDHYDLLGRRISWSYNNKEFWSDIKPYIDFCERHNIEVPKRGIYAHLCTTWLTYLSVRDAEKNAKILEAYKVNSEKFFFETDKITMVFPKTVQDFVNEGDTLNHCVGWNGYDSKVANGEAVIIFIRKKDNPEKAYYTCDLRKTARSGEWYINQLLGQNNCSIRDNEEMQLFDKEFGEFLKKIS